MNRSPKRLARNLIVLSLALIGLVYGLIVMPGSRRFAASSADDSRAATARSDQQTAGTPLINGVNTGPMPLTLADFGVARQRGRGVLPSAVRARAVAAIMASPFAPTITATLADALQVDNNNNGKADPGDTLMYTVTITNSGSDATGVTFTDDLSQNGGNLTLVPGSVMSAPVARPDSYPNGVGNTRMVVNAANGVLVNDFDPDGTTPTAVAITNGPTANGGTVSLATDGSFTYDPPVGFTGTDTFTYTATDGVKTDTATVSITLTERVWYVNSAAAVDGDGRSNTPFKVITGHLDGAGGAGDVDGPNDYIFLFSGSYSVASLPLESGQRLIGQGVNLVVNAQTLVTAATKPTLTATGTAVTLSTGNTVSGLDVSGASGITGSSVGALTISTVGATGTNGPAFDVQTAGAISVQFDSLSSSGSGIGLRLTTPTSGTFTVSGTTTINKTSGTGDGITITGGGATTTFTGAVSVTTFSGKGIVANAAGAITISSASSSVDATGGAALDLTSQSLGSGWNFTLLKSTNSAAEGIKMATCSGALTATTTNIQTPTGTGIDIQGSTGASTRSFGTTTVNKTAAGTGINLVGNGTAPVSFGALTLTAGNGSGLVATTSGTVNVASGTVTATNGPALNLSSVTAGITLTSASSTNSAATGITLATVGGSVSIGTTTVTNPTGIGINATSNTATLSFGSTTANGSGGAGIVLGGSGTGNTGTITFGSLAIAPDNNQRGLLAQENSNTITVTSGTISTVGSPASSGLPAIEITRSSSTTPLAISLTSVSANGSSTSGIILTRTSGSFTITGDGGSTNNSSGGTIQSTTGDGIALNTVQNISLDQMNVQNTGGGGISGTQTTNFTLTNSTINNSGNAAFESNVGFNTSAATANNLNGTVTITGNTLTNAYYSGVDIQSGDGTITNATISNNTITSTTSMATSVGFGININGTGTATTVFNLNKATINNNTISNFPTASGIQINGGNGNASGPGGTIGIPNDATNIIAITNNTIKGNSSANRMGGSAIIVAVQSVNSASRSRGNVNISNNGTVANPLTNIGGNVIGVGCNGYTTITSAITNNVIVANHVPNLGGPNGIAGGSGAGGAPVTSTPSLTETVTGNTISQTDGNGILIVNRANNGSLDLKIATNNVSTPINAGGTARQCIRVDSGNATAGEDTAVCLNISGNTCQIGSNGAAGIGIRKNGTVATTDDFGLTGLPSPPASGAQAASYVATQNPAGNGCDAISGNNYIACGTAPASPTPETASAMQPQSVKGDGATDATDGNTILKAHHGQVEPGSDVRQITLPEIVWMGQQAIQRWRDMGIPAEDLARLNSVTFEVGDLPSGQIASLRGTTLVIDEIAAGYGWYFDQNPNDDSEFDVPVFDRERQTTEFSPAHGKMDLLTVLMRELGSVYLEGKDKTPKKLRPLMNPLLLPGVRRMPTDRWNVASPSPVGAVQSPAKQSVQAQASAPAQPEALPNGQFVSAQVEGQRAVATATSNDVAAAARYAVFRPAANPAVGTGSLRPAAYRSRDVAVMGIHQSSFETEDMPTLRPVAMTTQKARGQKTFVPTATQSGGIVSVGLFNLPAGETVTIMFSATIDTPVAPPGTVQVCTRGAVTYTGGPAGGVLTTDPGPPAVNGATCTTLAQADLAVTKTDSPDPVITSNNITYTINLTNNGPDSAYNVKVSDAIPANTTFVSATLPAGWARTDSVAVGGTGTLVFEKSPAGPVPNGGTAQFTVVVNVNANTTGGTIITNNAVATSDTPDGNQANNTGTATTTAQAQADLALTKTDSPDPVIAGNNLTYTIGLTNNGPGTAQTVTVSDPMPAGTTLVSVTTPGGWTRTDSTAVGANGTIAFSKASVANAETATFTIVVKVSPSAANGSTLSNTATAASTTNDPTPGNNTATATTTVNTQADLAVTKTDSPDPVFSGNNITYTINFTNNGPSDAQSVTVTDPVPANATFVSATVTTGSGWSTSAPAVGSTGNVVFSKATVAASETAVFTIVVKVGSNVAAGVNISNTVTAATTTTDPTPSNDTATTTTTTQTAADLQVTKVDTPDPVTAGNNITYTITVQNNGPSDAQTVQLSDAVPANTTFVSITTPAGWTRTDSTAVGGTGTLTLTNGNFVAGGTSTFTLVVKVDSNTANGATITNSATATSATTDPVPANNTGTATTTVQASADLAVTKTASPSPNVFAGNNVTYTINFTNNGPSDAQSVTVTDAVPTNTTFVSATVTTGSGWSTSAPAVGGTGNVVFSKATVAGGETAVFTIVVKVDAATATGTVITNTATAATTTTDPNSANNTATATSTVQAQADLTLDKVASPSPDVIAGNNITYTLTLSNAGPGGAANVTVTDAVPANTTFVSATVTTGTGWSTSAPAVGGTGNVVFSKATVAASETAVFTIVVKVNSSAGENTGIANTATAASTTADPNPNDNTDATMTNVITRADLAVTKTDSPDPVFSGNNITYTINFSNNGPSDAQTVTVTDAVPANTTFVSATVTTGSGWTTSSPSVGGTGNVVFSKLTAVGGETAVFTIVVHVNSNTPSGTTISNTVTAATTTTDPTPSNDTATTTTTTQTAADLVVIKTDSPDPVNAGSNLTYTINFSNAGPSDAQTVTVTDAVPANTTLVSATVTTGAGWAVNTSGPIVFSKATVVAGESAVFTMVVKVNSNTANGATITNSATAASATTDPVPANNTGTATTTVQTSADLAITKTDTPDPSFAGNNITYTINFVNNGPSDAQTVTVTDAVPTNTTFVSATVTTGTGWSTSTPAVGGTGNVVFSKATVGATETAVFTIVVKVDPTTPTGTTVTNTATAATTTTDPNSGNDSATATTEIQAQADLSVTKTASPTPNVFAGNNITYTINLANAGPGAATSVTVTDAVPANTTFVSATVTTGTGWSTSAPAVGGTGNVVFSKATVSVSETAVFTIVVKVNSSTPNNTTITNTATAASTTADPNTNNNTDAAMVTALRRIDLAVTKTDSPDPVIAGAQLTYTINFANNGPSDASNVTVSDALPANTSLVSAVVTTGTGWSTNTSGPIVFSKSAVTAGESAVFTIVVQVNSNTANGATISNSVTASATETDTNSGNNTASATTAVITRADLVVTKSDAPDPVIAGNNLTYTINFSNAGPSDAQTVTVTDAVPANTTFVSATVTTGSGWSTSAPAVGGTGNVVFSKATAVGGESAVFTMVVKVSASTPDATVINNSASAATATTDPTPGNNTGTASTTVQTQADLAVTKSDSPDPAFAGNNITYTINFSNNGPSDGQTVTVTDAVPANTTFVSAVVTTGSGWSVSAPAVGGTGNVVFSKSTVAASGSAVFTIVVKVDSNTASGTVISNSAVAATTTTDPASGNNTGTATTTIQTQADLAVTKSDSPDPVIAGNNLTYTINFSNAGPSDAQTVTVTDAVPANTTFVSAVVTTGSGWSTSAPAVGGTGNVVFSKATVTNGESAVFTVIVKVNANTANGATISNSAVAASATGDGNSANNTGTATTSVITRADLAVTKSDSPDPVIAGNNLTYTINFVNNGPSDAQTVTVSDAVPANTSFVSAVVTTGTGWSTSTAGPIVFSKATVANGESAVFTIVVKVNANTANGATITNSATAATATTDPTSGNNTGTATTSVQTQADQAVTLTDAPDPVIAGNNITYTINYANNGPSDAQTVTVTDAVPANTTFVSATVTTGSGWSTSAPPVGSSAPGIGGGGKTLSSNIVFSKATVAASETAVFTIVVKVNSSATNGSTITDTVTAATATTDPTSANNTATATTTVQTQADLAVTKTDSPDPVVASQNLTYTITLNNNGPSDAQTVAVSDPLPANTTFVSATVTTGSGWSTTAPAVGGTGTVTFAKATMTASETAVFTIVVNVNANTPHNTTLTNTATATTATTDPTPGNNTATATTTVIAQADLAVTKSDSPDPVCVGGNITYTINFSNNGPGPGLNTTVTDGVPANTTFVSATVTTGSGWSTSAPAVGGTGNVVFSKANVGIGETAVFTVVVKVNAGVLHGTVISNTVTAASSIPDPNTNNNTATAQTTVDPIAPTITCPANITATAPLTCPASTTAVVNFAPTVTDNCSATYVCSPASGSAFPVGTTTVSCTATDTAGNTATCSFNVTVFSGCLQDESNPGNVCFFDAQTGRYQFCCNGQVVATGTGTVRVQGCVISIQHFKGERRVVMTIDLSQKHGVANINISNVLTCQINDLHMENNTCLCPLPTP